jgi:putative oxidoreductase
MAKNSTNSFQSLALFLLRVVAGFTFSLHGAQKILGLFGGVAGSGASARLFSLAWTAGVIELIGGLLIVFGCFTRPVAFVLSGHMAVAYFMVHQPNGTLPIRNGGELAVLYCFIFLYLFAAGAGKWSLDAKLRRKS